MVSANIWSGSKYPKSLGVHFIIALALGASEHSQHVPGKKCWNGTFDNFFNGTKQRRTIKKPPKLPLRQSFLCVDKKVIEAFILLTVDDELWPKIVHKPPPKFHFGTLEIIPEVHKASGEILVHVTSTPNPHPARNLTVKEINCLLRGYPPYYREYLDCYNQRVPSPIRNDADVYRGGWIIGVGLSSTTPVPLYFDTFRAPTEDRGTVFWKAITRVKTIVENNIKPLFPDERVARNIQATINGLDYLIKEKTISGLTHTLQYSDMAGYTARNLTQNECATVIRIFNDSPRLDEAGLARLKDELSPMLLEVLAAALDGARTCVDYVRNPGRELDRMMPDILAQAERVFLRGCEDSL
ncbi:hypothetical protein GALMADRAFT_137274 [Galerina marginata CBS 339.88]|uniref:Uncharacterized protein n=1 Tax=Galerina marginata (strain CBS 339.88) TaxID=685588 RepID=A0A067TAT9_GALM3|nr:hypothetical protein GALMADRAFT_137274 [Galerina marginata CBS 339.88]